MALDVITYALSKDFTSDSLEGIESLKGAPCTIKSTTETSEGTNIIFEWIGTSGSTETTDIFIKNGANGLNGISVVDANINDKGELILTLDNNVKLNAGTVPSVKGDKGDSAYAIVKKNDGITTITLTDINGTTSAEIKDGENGKDGISPIVELERTTENDGVSIIVKNADGSTSTQTVYDGSDDIIEIRKTDYDLLSEDEKKDKIFYVYDDEDGTITWESLSEKPFETIDENTLSIEDGKLKVVGGNSDTVNGHTVESDVPSDAKFTDTVYALPTASGDTLGGVKTTSTVTNISTYTPCPIVDGVPYYRDTNISPIKIIRTETTLGSDNYYKDDSGNIIIKIPITGKYFYRNVFDVYISTTYNVTDGNGGAGFSHLTIFPRGSAYPTMSNFYNVVDSTSTSTGGAIITSFTATTTASAANLENYLIITVTGYTGNWHDYLFVLTTITD